MSPNPYAAPAAHGGPAGHGYGHGHGAQASLRGDVLVVQKDAALPAVCMKCGTQENIVRRQGKFSWTPAWARLLVLVCTIGALVAILLTTKRGQLSMPLCASCNARWSGAIGALIGGVVALVFGVFALGAFDEPAFGAVLFFVILAAFVGVMVGVVKPRILQVHKIDDHVIELKGVHPEASRIFTGG